MDEHNLRETNRRIEHLSERLETIEGRIDDTLEKISDEIERLKEAVIGGLDGEEGLKVKVSRYEKELNENRSLISALAKTVHGDVLGRGSLIDLVKSSVVLSEEAKKAANDAVHIVDRRTDIDTSRRGQNFLVWCAILSFVGVISVALFNNWEKIAGKKETPDQWAARITKDIEQMKKERGPEVEKKLKDIERAARRHP